MSPTAYGLYMQWYSGFCCGAGCRPIDTEKEQHENTEMRKAFSDGFNEGRLARGAAAMHARERYGCSDGTLRGMTVAKAPDGDYASPLALDFTLPYTQSIFASPNGESTLP